MGMSNRERCADHLELLNLEAIYAKTWDSCDARGWAEVFTHDGVFEIAAVGDRQAIRIEGRNELEQFCSDFTATTKGVHLPSIPALEIQDGIATGHLNFHFVAVGRQNPAHTITRTATGYYVVRYKKVDGAWLVEHRVEKVLESSRAEFFDY